MKKIRLKNKTMELVKFILKNAYFKDGITSSNGDNMMMVASLNGYFDIVKYFVEESVVGIDINHKNCIGETAATYAARNKHFEIVQYFIDAGCYEIDHYSMLLFSIDKNNQEDVQFYLEEILRAKKLFNKKNALLYALYYGHCDAVKLFVESGRIDIHERDLNGETAIILASESGYLDIVKYLVEVVGANINDVDIMGYNALISACEKGHIDIVKYLVDCAGADINYKNSEGKNALIIAVKNKRGKIYKYILEKIYEISGENLECPICYEDITFDNIIFTNCNHSFHYTCLSKWFINDNITCPMCRKDII